MAVTVNVNMPAATPTSPVLLDEPKSTGVAYILWALGGGFGLHRFYLGRPHAITMIVLLVLSVVTSIVGIGLLGLGALGIWLLMDAVAIPKWVSASRALALAPIVSASTVSAPALPAAAAPAPTGDLQLILLRAAMEKNGVLTVTEGVMASGKSFKEVEKCLSGMVDSGYVDVDNAPGTGVVTYVFAELRQ